MPDAPNTLPLLRLGRLELDPGLRALQPGQDASGLVATATVEVPDSVSEPQHAWDVALADAVREAGKLGADERTAQALAAGAGNALAGGTWIVVAAHGQVLLVRRLPHGAAAPEVRVGPLPHLLQAAAFAARRPAHVVLLADRDDAAVIAHAPGDQRPAQRFGAPDARCDTHPDRPAAQHHGERHVTGSEPESGGERNAASIAARVSEAAASVGAHIVLGAGDQHILDAVAGHLPGPLRAITTIAAGPVPTDSDDLLSPRIDAALDGIAGEAIGAVGNLVASSAAGAAYGIDPSPSSWPSSRSPCCSWRPTSHGTATARATGSGAARPSSSSATPTSAPRCRWRTGWSGPHCTRMRSSCSCRTAPARWPASPWPPCSAADRLTTARSG